MSVRHKTLTGLAAAALTIGVAAPALATVTPAGGGTWSYGFTGNGTSVYSDYYHPDVTHRGSTINYWGEYSCDWATADYWANDSQRADPTSGHTDYAYWAKLACP